jgi:hypothetical protein
MLSRPCGASRLIEESAVIMRRMATDRGLFVSGA